MNKTTLLAAFVAFLIPIGIVIALNFDSISEIKWETTRPTGRLLYFYSPT